MRTAVPETDGVEVAMVLRHLVPCRRVTLLAFDGATGATLFRTWGATDDPARIPALECLRGNPNEAEPLRIEAPGGPALVLPISVTADDPAAWVLSRTGGEFGPAELDAARLITPGLRLRWRLGHCLPDGLTNRELDILRLVAEGLTATAVGHRCKISIRTVHKHLEHAYSKLGCHDRLTAVLILRDAGLLAGRATRPA